MRRFIMILSLLLSGIKCANAQKHDNNWLWGVNTLYQDSAWWPMVGNGQGDFSDGTFQSYSKFRNMAFYQTNSNFSDAEGNLQFYSNGMWIMDTTGRIVENGDSLGFGQWWLDFRGDAISGQAGLPLFNSIVFLPHPNSSDSIVDCFHIRGDSSINNVVAGYWGGSICHTTIVKKNGAYRVTVKNEVFTETKPTLGILAACKHGNGRDWWIIFMEDQTNCYHKYLLTPDSLFFVSKQCLGTVVTGYTTGDGGKALFSLDGSKFARYSGQTGNEVFDFDRCTGEFSNRKHTLPFFVYDTTTGDIIDFVFSIEISPNNRFVYNVVSSLVIQYDLAAIDINASLDTVGVQDTYIDTIPFSNNSPLTFHMTQLAPDGQIYVGSAGYDRFYSTIDNSDGKGFLCGFDVRAIVLPRRAFRTISQFPNYRLGRLPGSACDTVYNSIKPLYAQAPWLKVYPNPAADEVKMDYNWVEWETVTNVELRITNSLGQVVQVVEVPRYSTMQQVNVGHLAAGMYTVQLSATKKGKAIQLATAKMSKL